MADRIGQHLGNYRLIRLLGQGGFAEVYLGEHIHLNTQAAIKVLRTQLASDDISGFRTEARTIANLAHPNIVQVLDFGIEGSIPFLVMTYAPNGTVRQRQRRGTPLPSVTIVPYVKQLASALQYAHNQKLIHRDIKPENMLLGRNNEVLLSDFGIALVGSSAHAQGLLNKSVPNQGSWDPAGTVIYMAPEQIQGKSSPASDQYSLAVVVYEWLTGVTPFHGTYIEIAMQHMSAPPPRLCDRVPTILPDVEEVVLTALAKDPRQRFPNIQAFAAVLEQALQLELPTLVKPLPNVLAPPVASPTSPVNIGYDVDVQQIANPLLAQPSFSLHTSQQQAPQTAPGVYPAATTANVTPAQPTSQPGFPNFTLPPVQPRKKRRRRLWVALVLVVLGLLSGTGAFAYKTLSASTPEKTLDIYCNALLAQDYLTAYNQLSTVLQKSETESQFANMLKAQGKVTSCKHGSASLHGATALANLTFGSSAEQNYNSSVTLTQDSGNTWKISVPFPPSITLTTFCYALKTKDYQTAYDQLAGTVKSQLTEADFETTNMQQDTQVGGITSCSVSNVSEGGSSAIGTVTFLLGNGQKGDTHYSLANEGGFWKIDGAQ